MQEWELTSALTLETTVRQFTKPDFCCSDLGVAFGHSRLNLCSPGESFSLLIEMTWELRVLTQLPLQQQVFILADHGRSILRAFSSSSSCFTLSLINFCFSSISFKDFKSSLTSVWPYTLQKNIVMLVKKSLLRTLYFSLLLFGNTCANTVLPGMHLRQHSHSMLFSSMFLLNLTHTKTSPDLFLIYLVDGNPPPSLSSDSCILPFSKDEMYIIGTRLLTVMFYI